MLVRTCERDCQATKFYESNDLRFNSLELGGSTSWYSHVHARHYAIDPVGPQGQLRNYKDSPRSWVDSADATRCSLWVRKFIKHFYDYERKLRELMLTSKENNLHQNCSFGVINYNTYCTLSCIFYGSLLSILNVLSFCASLRAFIFVIKNQDVCFNNNLTFLRERYPIYLVSKIKWDGYKSIWIFYVNVKKFWYLSLNKFNFFDTNFN